MSVQSAHNSTASSVGSLAATFGAGVGNNNLVRGFVTWGTGTVANLTGVSDDKGNTYSIPDKIADAGLGQSTASFYKEGITNAPTVVTAQLDVSGPVTAPMTIVISEETGLAAVSALDGHAGQQQTHPGTGTDAITSGNATTTANGDLVCSCVMGAPLTSTVAGTSYTVRESDTAVTFQLKCEDTTQASSGAIAGTWTDATNGAGSNYTTLVMAFKVSASAGNLAWVKA